MESTFSLDDILSECVRTPSVAFDTLELLSTISSASRTSTLRTSGRSVSGRSVARSQRS